MMKKPKRKYRIKVGDWVCAFVKITGLHGRHQIVVRIGGTEATLLRSECRHPDHDGQSAPEKEKL